MNPGELCEFQFRPDLAWERVRVLVPPGCSGIPDVLAVFLRLRDNKRLVLYRSGRVKECRA